MMLNKLNGLLKDHYFTSWCLYTGGFPGGSDSEESAWNAGDLGSIPGSGRSPGEGNGNPWRRKWQPLEKEMAIFCLENFLAWKIPWTEEPGRLQSMGSQRVGQFEV